MCVFEPHSTWESCNQTKDKEEATFAQVIHNTKTVEPLQVFAPHLTFSFPPGHDEQDTQWLPPCHEAWLSHFLIPQF